MQATSTKSAVSALSPSAPKVFHWRRKHTSIAAASGAALLLIVVAIVLVKKGSGSPPPMNAPIEQMARFVGSSGFLKLPFDRQREYMQHLHAKKKDLADAYKEHKLSHEVALQASNYAWCGKRLLEMQLYASAGEGQARETYLTNLALREIEKDKKKKSARAGTTSQPAAPPVADADDVLPKHDQGTVREIIMYWPEDVQRQWRNFDQDLVERQAEIKREKKGAGGKSAIKTSGKRSAGAAANGSRSAKKSGGKKNKANTPAPTAPGNAPPP